jgi:hypothetical protein
MSDIGKQNIKTLEANEVLAGFSGFWLDNHVILYNEQNLA